MREIKFRVWDTEEKCITTGDDDQGSLLGEEGGYFELRGFRDRYILMQFTGLKDKNGKEIYEGDIVKYKDEFFTEQTTDISFDIKKGYQWEYFELETIEIIGNVYENPELLK